MTTTDDGDFAITEPVPVTDADIDVESDAETDANVDANVEPVAATEEIAVTHTATEEFVVTEAATTTEELALTQPEPESALVRLASLGPVIVPAAEPWPAAEPTDVWAATGVASDPVASDPVASDPVASDPVASAPPPRRNASSLEAVQVSAWFGDHKVLERVSLVIAPATVTALIGPSGCGKSTFLRILNRMHEETSTAKMSGEVLLDGADVYAPGRRVTETRRSIGMVFQKPNPFPAMSIADNVTAGLRLIGTRLSRPARAAVVEECLIRAGLWAEVRDRLGRPGGTLSGGQQQRLCIARSLAVDPHVLLMDEPCSALDPTSTRYIEETIAELALDMTIVIVTHNMQQAARVSQRCAFFLCEDGAPGRIVESGATEQIFGDPVDPRTADYVHGHFG